MEREYYIYWYRLDNKDGYLIWFTTDENDGLVIDETGLIPNFNNMDDLKRFAINLQISVDIENPNLIDFDFVKNWLNLPNIIIDDYNPFLEAWNLSDDISISTNGNFDLDKDLTNSIYNKIFWGCNLPSMTPEGESFTPTWTKKELKIIRETLKLGFQIFVEKVKSY